MYYLSLIMAEPQERFEMLAERFAVLAHDLNMCQTPAHRHELLKAIVVVLGELDRLESNDKPLGKAAHQ